MLKRLSAIVVLLIAAASLFAGEGVRRTVVIRDGQVVFDGGAPAGKRAFIGLAMTELSPDLRDFFGAPKNAGVLVASVALNGPAAKAGVRVGDVIIAVNGDPVESPRSLVASMKDKHAGDALRLDIVRARARQTIVATAEEREASQMLRALDLGRLERDLGVIAGPEWRARIAAPDTEELRTRIRDLETRLQELEKKLQQQK